MTEQIKRTALQNRWRFQTRSHSYTLPYLAMLELPLILSGERLSLPPALPNAPQLHLNTPLCSLKSFPEKKEQKKQQLWTPTLLKKKKMTAQQSKPATKSHNYTSVCNAGVIFFPPQISLARLQKIARLKIPPLPPLPTSHPTTPNWKGNYLWHLWWNIKANLSVRDVCGGADAWRYRGES